MKTLIIEIDDDNAAWLLNITLNVWKKSDSTSLPRQMGIMVEEAMDGAWANHEEYSALHPEEIEAARDADEYERDMTADYRHEVAAQVRSINRMRGGV